MKRKLTSMLRGKERKKRKNRYLKLNRSRWRRFIYIKDKRTVGKANKGLNVEKNVLGLKVLKIKSVKDRKERNGGEKRNGKKRKVPQNCKSPT